VNLWIDPVATQIFSRANPEKVQAAETGIESKPQALLVKTTNSRNASMQAEILNAGKVGEL